MTEGRQNSYELLFTKDAERFFRTHEYIRDQYKAAIRELITGDHPESVNVKRIQGKRSNYYRIRLGDYRVIYTIINGKIIVINTLLAGSQGDIYKKIDTIK